MWEVQNTNDVNRGIALIEYDYMNNPKRIQFTNGNVTKYIYSATGEKLRTIYQTAVPNITVAMGSKRELTDAEVLYKDSVDYYHGGKLTVKNGRLDKCYFDGGYAQAYNAFLCVAKPSFIYSGMLEGEEPTEEDMERCRKMMESWHKQIEEHNNTDAFFFHYYTADHLGNIREVINEDGAVEQITNYYPFGTPYATEAGNTNPDLQNHKYNGKELDTMHGLNTYDYGARQYNSLFGRWDRMDPLCEKYYSVSPYAYCLNNPVKNIDPDGRKVRIYPENQKQVLGYINKVAQGTFAVDKNGYLYLAKASNTKGYSATYTKSLLNAIKNEDKTINIYISDHYIDSDGSKQSLSKKGEGTTTVTSDGTIVVAISGKSYDKLEDKEGNPISDDPEYILAHELAGHAEPNMNKTDDDSVGNAVEIENTIRRETYKEERKEEPWHVW